MLNSFFVYMFIYIIFILHSLFQISIGSLQYHARKYDISAETLRVFLAQLRFPLNILRINEVSRLWDEDSSDSTFTPLDIGTIYLITVPFIIILAFGILTNIYDIFVTFGDDDYWINVFWLVVSILSILLLRPWRFGHKLGEIEKQVQHNALDVAQITETK